MITLVVTSFNRFDLLTRTLESFQRVNDYPISSTIIIEDSGSKQMHSNIKHFTKGWPNTLLMLNETNIGLVESIDKAYSMVSTPYIWHTEDDFDYFRPGFIDRCVKVMQSDDKICRVGIRGKTHVQSLDDTIYMGNDVPYKLSRNYAMDEDVRGNQFWFGFGFQCGLINKAAYDVVKPYTQYSTADEFITIRECRIGLAYHALGYKAVSLTEDYVRHTGSKRSTYGLNMEG